MSMDLSAGASPKSGTEPSFRKRSADAANRKYRRPCSSSRSDSSSAEDCPERERNSKHRRSRSPFEHKESHSKEIENWQRKDDSRDIEKESSRARSGRGHESGRHSDRHLYGTSRESKRHDDYRRYHDRADEDEKTHPRSSRSGRESRVDNYSDRARRHSISDRSRCDSRNAESEYGERSENPEHRSKNKEKETFPREHPRYDDGEHDRDVDGRKQKYSTRDHGGRGGKRDSHRTSEKYKDGYASREDYKEYSAEKEKSKSKEIDEQEKVPRKRNGKESEKYGYGRESEAETRDRRRSLFSSAGPDVKNNQHFEGKSDMSETKSSTAETTFGCTEGYGKPLSSSKQVLEASDGAISSSKEGGASDDVNAAKVAAMRAAELVNRNIVGFGGVGSAHLSTDQKKKLLWGSKKNNAAEETTKRWDLNLFADRERQEKFNKLMGVKGSVVPEDKVISKDGNVEEAKKQEELDMDLEKHYIAGLRRRDGRTVGLGL